MKVCWILFTLLKIHVLCYLQLKFHRSVLFFCITWNYFTIHIENISSNFPVLPFSLKRNFPLHQRESWSNKHLDGNLQVCASWISELWRSVIDAFEAIEESIVCRKIVWSRQLATIRVCSDGHNFCNHWLMNLVQRMFPHQHLWIILATNCRS